MTWLPAIESSSVFGALDLAWNHCINLTLFISSVDPRHVPTYCKTFIHSCFDSKIDHGKGPKTTLTRKPLLLEATEQSITHQDMAKIVLTVARNNVWMQVSNTLPPPSVSAWYPLGLKLVDSFVSIFINGTTSGSPKCVTLSSIMKSSMPFHYSPVSYLFWNGGIRGKDFAKNEGWNYSNMLADTSYGQFYEGKSRRREMIAIEG